MNVSVSSLPLYLLVLPDAVTRWRNRCFAAVPSDMPWGECCVYRKSEKRARVLAEKLFILLISGIRWKEIPSQDVIELARNSARPFHASTKRIFLFPYLFVCYPPLSTTAINTRSAAQQTGRARESWIVELRCSTDLKRVLVDVFNPTKLPHLRLVSFAVCVSR